MQVLVGMNVWYFSPPPAKPKYRVSDAWFATFCAVTHWRHILFFISIFSVYFASSDLRPPGGWDRTLVTPLAFRVV